MERAGDIDAPWFSPVSGKLEFYFNGRVKVVSEPGQLFSLMRPSTKDRIRQLEGKV